MNAKLIIGKLGKFFCAKILTNLEIIFTFYNVENL